RLVALLSGALLTTFGLAMTVALGVKAPLNFSVFSAAGGALLLAEHADVPFSVDELLRRHRQEKGSRPHHSTRPPGSRDILATLSLPALCRGRGQRDPTQRAIRHSQAEQ